MKKKIQKGEIKAKINSEKKREKQAKNERK